MKTSFHASALCLEFEGDLLSTNIASLRTEILGILEAHPTAQSLVADIRAANKVDSQGLNLLVALLREAERRGIGFRVENANADIRRLITLLKLATRFGIEPLAVT
jgi:anti-anti-sigma factor